MYNRFKFRVWNGEMYCMDFRLWNIVYDLERDPTGGLMDHAGVSALWYEMFEQGAVIEQCTGLKDRNGKLIYEGDIITVAVLGAIPTGMMRPVYHCVRAKVEWRYNCWFANATKNEADLYFPDGAVFSWGKSLVIGNIHENPELLEAPQ